MDTLTMGILAHVDAGKTSLTERLLYAAGVLDRIGSVDAGSTRTDSMELERRRGITIRSAVVSFELAGRTVNLIDTPGHADFVAEVERALAVLDGAVLVLSAVEGVQVQTRLLMRTLRRLGVPLLLFVNKIDRMGARYDDLLADVRRLLTPSAVPLGTVRDLGTRAAGFVPFPPGSARVDELLAEHDDAYLARYLDDRLTPADQRRELAAQVRRGVVQPVYFGSAVTGAGVPELIEGIGTWLPSATGSAADRLHASVFKVERGRAGEKIASARVFTGTLAEREQLDVFRADGGPAYQLRPTWVGRFEQGATVRTDVVEAGRIVALRGVRDLRIGDQLGSPGQRSGQLFAPPTLETVVRARDRIKLVQALQELADQDPLIQVRTGAETTVSLYGEVQKEVIAALLADEYGLAVTFDRTRPLYQEVPRGTGTAVREYATGHPWAAGVGFRVSPGPGFDYRREVELGALPRAYHAAIEETVVQTLWQGLHGWAVAGLRVDLVHTAYDAPVTVAADFRRLVPVVLLEALAAAGTTVLRPMHHFELDLPAASLAAVLGRLAEHQAIVGTSEPDEDGQARLAGLIPAEEVSAFATRLPGLTHGEGVLVSAFAAFHPVPGAPPYRSRTDGNPLDLKQYLVHLKQS